MIKSSADVVVIALGLLLVIRNIQHAFNLFPSSGVFFWVLEIISWVIIGLIISLVIPRIKDGKWQE